MTAITRIRNKILPEIGDHLNLIEHSISTLSSKIELIREIGFKGEALTVQRQGLIKLNIASKLVLRSLREFARYCHRDSSFHALVFAANLPNYKPEYVDSILWASAVSVLTEDLCSINSKPGIPMAILLPATRFADALLVLSNSFIGLENGTVDDSGLKALKIAYELLEEQIDLLWDIVVALDEPIAPH